MYVFLVVDVYFRLIYDVLAVAIPVHGAGVRIPTVTIFTSSLCSDLLNTDLLWFDMMVFILGL